MLQIIKLLISIIVLTYGMQAYCLMVPTSDHAITEKIKSKMATDKSIARYHIGVSTQHGVVTLTGKLNSARDKSTLTAIAQETDGVKDVNTSHLQVRKKAQ